MTGKLKLIICIYCSRKTWCALDFMLNFIFLLVNKWCLALCSRVQENVRKSIPKKSARPGVTQTDRTFHVYIFYAGSNFLSTCWLRLVNQGYSSIFNIWSPEVCNNAALIYIFICSINRRRCYHRHRGRWQLQRRQGRESRGYFKLGEEESLLTVRQRVSWW